MICRQETTLIPAIAEPQTEERRYRTGRPESGRGAAAKAVLLEQEDRHRHRFRGAMTLGRCDS